MIRQDRIGKTKTCSKCGGEQPLYNFAWKKQSGARHRVRKDRCRTCTKQPLPSFSDPSPIDLSYEDALEQMQTALEYEAGLAKSWAEDTNHKFYDDPVGALHSLTKPRRIRTWYAINGFPAGTTIRDYKSYMVQYEGDPDTLLQIMHAYRVFLDTASADQRSRRLAIKMKLGPRACEHCGSPIDPTIDIRKLHCSNACKQAAYRERRKTGEDG